MFERKIIRKIYGPILGSDGLRGRKNEEMNSLLKQRNIVRYIKAQRIAWTGHQERMSEERTIKKITSWKPISSIPKGRPKRKWEDDVRQNLQTMKVKNCKTLARRKEQWKEIVGLAKAHTGL